MVPAVTEETAGHGQSEQWEVADIFRLYGEDYRSRHPLPPSHLRVMHAIEVCRTPSLGGHVCRSATPAAMNTICITPAVTGTAQSASLWQKHGGSMTERQSFFL
jgi:hypothetical protein